MIQLLFALACGWLATVCWRSELPAAKTAALASVMIAVFGILQSPYLGLPADHTALIMADNVAHFISLPLISLIIVHHCQDWNWQAATWGRIFLGLAAMFELGRQMDFNDIYLLIICGAWIAALVSAATMYAPRWQAGQRALLGACGLYLGWLMFKHGAGDIHLVTQAAHATAFMALFSLYKPVKEA